MMDTNDNARSGLQARLRDLIALHLQQGLFEKALTEHREAVANLRLRQVEHIHLTDEPDFQRNLIADILAVTTSVEGLAVHSNELLCNIQKVVGLQDSSNSAT